MTPTFHRTISLLLQTRSAGCAALCSVALLSACASLKPQAPEDIVRQRAGERWQALLANDFEKAYKFNTAAYRALVTLQAFRSEFGPAVKWVGTEVTKVECPELAKCAVQIKLDYKPVLGGRVDGHYSTFLDESWLLDANQWSVYQPIGK